LDPKTGQAVFTNAELTANAVKQLFTKDDDMDSIGCLACGTTLADQLAPNHAVMVHGELKNKHCEVNAASGICMSGIAALKYAWMAIKCGEHTKAVSTGSETASVMLRAEKFSKAESHTPEELEKQPELAFEKDFLRWMLSDGAGAFLLENTPTAHSAQPVLRVDWIKMLSFANELETCMYAWAEKGENGALRSWTDFEKDELMNRSILTISQDVRLLNKNIIDVVLIKALKLIVEETNLNVDEIDYFLPHISSMYFYKRVDKALTENGFHIPQEKWFTNLTTRGNTGSASIYIMLDELLKSGKVKSGNKILCFIPESGRFSSSFMLLTAV
jgi:3-oxoacyl-[acyl-carrier-protein] synthase-3